MLKYYELKIISMVSTEKPSTFNFARILDNLPDAACGKEGEFASDLRASQEDSWMVEESLAVAPISLSTLETTTVSANKVPQVFPSLCRSLSS